jgi:predicted RNA-binding protein with PIN domain
MSYLIDGHNLIPHTAGIQLGDPDDELALVQRLVEFAGRRRTTLEVYFDRGQPGQPGQERYGRVRVHFIREGKTADRAIRDRLDALGRAAKNWRVVSSDREVIREARAHRAQVVRSADFARQLDQEDRKGPAGSRENPQPEMSPEEVQYWLDQFRGD